MEGNGNTVLGKAALAPNNYDAQYAEINTRKNSLSFSVLIKALDILVCISHKT